MAVELGRRIVKDTVAYKSYAIGITLPLTFGENTFEQSFQTKDQIKSNIKNLLLTKRGERILQPQFGSGLQSLLFEQNDKLTRDRAVQLFNSFLSDLLSKRALTDFAVVCDSSNNTPIRIDRNELYIDVAIAPTKSVEFIYIPIRIVNTGAL
jgi:hypothetical protein